MMLWFTRYLASGSQQVLEVSPLYWQVALASRPSREQVLLDIGSVAIGRGLTGMLQALAQHMKLTLHKVRYVFFVLDHRRAQADGHHLQRALFAVADKSPWEPKQAVCTSSRGVGSTRKKIETIARSLRWFGAWRGIPRGWNFIEGTQRSVNREELIREPPPFSLCSHEIECDGLICRLWLERGQETTNHDTKRGCITIVAAFSERQLDRSRCIV